MSTQPSYCEQRLTLYGITKEWNQVKAKANSTIIAEEVTQAAADAAAAYANSDHPTEALAAAADSLAADADRMDKKAAKFKKYPIFTEGPEDCIEIRYLTLQGTLEEYKGDNKWSKQYIRRRINPSIAKPDQKYAQPPKSGTHIHLNPAIIEKYQKGIKVKTLFCVEGEFKHWTGYMHGLDIVGLPSIHAYKEKDTEELHFVLKEILRVCQVEDLVMIYDADLLSVSWDKFEANEDYDLGKRANSFYSSARNIRDYAKRLVQDVYLCHIDTDYLNRYNGSDSVKGLDDLFLFHKGKEAEVVSELKLVRSSKKMFSYINITAESPGKIREFFRLRRDKRGCPDQFFSLYHSRLESKEFTFLGFKYKYSQIKDELEVMKHPDSDDFIRVGCDFVKIIKKPELIRGIPVTRRVLKIWKTGEMQRDYVNKGYKNFFDTVAKYDAFTNYPDNTDKFKQVIDNCYNMYYKVTHVPEPGEFPTINLFLTHLFQSAQQITMAMDYITLLYRHPCQNLPILALVSEERGTGKTKFLELLREIFCENATILGNDAITDNFNDDYASKLIIGIDEGLIEKKATMEKIKSWSTATRIKMNAKFTSREEIPFYGKVVIASNNTDSFVQIEDEETRFWVVKVPRIEKEDPRFMEKMIKEIPAFIHYLATRKIEHADETRQWFGYQHLETTALRDLKENSVAWLPKELRAVLEEEFSKYQYHCLSYTLSEIMELLNGRNAGARFRASEAQRFLQKKFKTKARMMRPDFPVHDVDGRQKATNKKANGRYYQLYIENFLDYESIKEIGYNMEQLFQYHAEDINVVLWPGQTPIVAEQAQLNLDITPGIFTGNSDNLPY